MTNTKQKLQSILDRCEAATDGPWDWDRGKFVSEGHTGEPQIHPAPFGVLWDPYPYDGADDITTERYEDAHFIANARTDLPAVTRALMEVVAWCDDVKSGESDGSESDMRALRIAKYLTTEIKEALNE